MKGIFGIYLDTFFSLYIYDNIRLLTDGKGIGKYFLQERYPY